jgi:hypothetical protein
VLVKPISARLVLKERGATKPIYQKEDSLYRKLEENDYRPKYLSVEEINLICTHIEYITGIDPKAQLKSIGLTNSYYKTKLKSKYIFKGQENTFKMLVELARRNIPIDFDLAEEICTYWNNQLSNMNTSEFAKISVSLDKKVFINAAIVITYTMQFKAKSKENFKKAIDIILDSGIPSFTYNKNNLYALLSGRIIFNKKFDHLFEAKNGYEFRSQYFYNGSKHEELFNGKFKSLFLNIFFRDNTVRGNLVFAANKLRLSKWFDYLSAEFTAKKPFRNTCGLKLVGKNGNIGPLLEEYFLYLTTQKSNVLATDLIKEGWWSSFVDHVRYTYGYSDFWKLVSKRS